MPENKQHATDEELLNKALPIPKDDDDDLESLEPLEVENLEVGLEDPGSTKIQQFGTQSMKHADHWERTPNTPGTGAIHVKTFVSKLRLDAIEHLDQQVNEWLDAHPEYEVKFVTTTVGRLVGKNIEEAMFMNVWV